MSTKLVPLTTRPLSTSRQGMTRFRTIRIRLERRVANLAAQRFFFFLHFFLLALSAELFFFFFFLQPKLAVTVVFAVGVNVQRELFLQPATPFQPVNELFFALAVRVRAVAPAKVAVQVFPQLIPAGTLVTVPEPRPAFFTVSVCRPSTLPALTTSRAAAEIGLNSPPSSGLAVTETTRPFVAIALRPSAHRASRVAPGARPSVTLSPVVKLGTPASKGLFGTRMVPSDVKSLSLLPGMKGGYPPDSKRPVGCASAESQLS